MLNDLYRFCVVGNSVLRVGITFELVNSLWLTDTTYTNKALVDLSEKHPEFPGPSLRNFRKTRESYRRFAGELVFHKPELLGLKKIGHDLHKVKGRKSCTLLSTCKNGMPSSCHPWGVTRNQKGASWQKCMVHK